MAEVKFCKMAIILSLMQFSSFQYSVSQFIFINRGNASLSERTLTDQSQFPNHLRNARVRRNLAVCAISRKFPLYRSNDVTIALEIYFDAISWIPISFLTTSNVMSHSIVRR
jgi:hypothetical protein